MSFGLTWKPLRFLTSLAAMAMICLSTAMAADEDIQAPEGFVLQHLDATDGLIARPKDWFYTRSGTPSGWLWVISAEAPKKGGYETGLRIRMLVGIKKGTGRTHQELALGFLQQKRQTSEVVKDCPVSEVGQFKRQCLETLEADFISKKNAGKFHILYSVFWAESMDMVTVTTFGAPENSWDQAVPIADVMSKFRLLGPNFGKTSG